MTTDAEQEVSELPEGRARLVIGLFGLAAFCYFTWDASNMPLGQLAMPGPGLFPLIIGTFGIVASAIVIVDALFKLRQGATLAVAHGRTAKQLIGILLLLVLFVLIIDLVGTYLAAIVFCALSVKLLSPHPWWRSVLYGATMAVICVFIFDGLLNVSLPRFGLW